MTVRSLLSRAAVIALLTTSSALAPAVSPLAVAAGGGAVIGADGLSGFVPQTLPANDDGSTGAVDLGFTLNFFGTPYSSVYVNNNGNITFAAPSGSYTPYGLVGSTTPIIAPFFADVDTRGGNEVTYGTAVYDGEAAFVVNWHDVGCYSANQSVLNDFQLVLVDRGAGQDQGAGSNFDILFNYDSITWDTGRADGGDAQCLNGGTNGAAVGYSSGTGRTEESFELPGSRASGSLIDSNPDTGLIHHSLGTSTPGRYIFAVQDGTPVVKEPMPSKFLTTPALVRLAPPALPLLQLSASLIAETDPVIGRPVTFFAGSTALCRVVTDGKGAANCSARSASKARAVLAANGYTVVFAGDDEVAPSTGRGGLIR